MIFCAIYLVIGLWLGLRIVNNIDSEEITNGYYFAGLVVGGYLWPLTIIIGVIQLIKNRKDGKA